MRDLILGLTAGLLLAAGPLWAGEAPDARVGDQTRSWIELQKSGAQASSAESIIPGEVADRIYERYLDSFSQPIPEHFQRVRFGDGQ